ncbi:DUF1329 domain-containing protein [Paraperlucidibaca sp.]|jgi:hypothetical protein|uniref:DUF1329 domain-containing protein n=1 Tax=Paraperlucidibaca sp. TaxID=2708021 RepID=UPI0030F3FF9F|tara:strand:- start:592 stop:1944 length:1353 start_codon:yes stop_codon:yes gene_type:complete
MNFSKLALAAALSIIGSSALAVGADEAAKLGGELTPVGAEKAGNADGTIPAWTGGITKAPAGFKEGDHYPNPFAGEKAKFTISASNMGQYAANLTAGQQALLKKYPTWKMNVYPTHRTAAYPQAIYEASKANATRVKLAPGGNGFDGASVGVPFPIPKTGVEPMLNHITAYRGDSFAVSNQQVAVTTGGSYTPVRFEYEYDFHYNNLRKSPADREDNKLTNFLQTVTAPARLAGQVLLIHEYINQIKNPRQAWSYNPGQRRVRLAPNVAYDNPGVAADGLRTNDDFTLFNGATDRYNWTLVGKKEIYVPYNSYDLGSNKIKISDIIRPGHINPDHARYELHRVWVVEAKLKSGTSHIYSRRTFYIDEDSWTILATDAYDGRGQLWRVAEQHVLQAYDIPGINPTAEVHHDLQSGRYLAMGLVNEESKVYTRISRNASDFSPSGLRSMGTR